MIIVERGKRLKKGTGRDQATGGRRVSEQGKGERPGILEVLSKLEISKAH